MKQTKIDLIPTCQNPSPDYYCTWQTQLYATSDGKPAGQRAILGETALFAPQAPYGWADLYPEARTDLLFVMDDSWDVPQGGDSAYFGSLRLDAGKFPQAYAGAADHATALRRLCNRVTARGWKGLGGWVCAQESPLFPTQNCQAYWAQRLREAEAAGFAYWKVDWGEHGADPAFRRRLTDMARELAPSLTVEHAVVPQALTYADVYRTYDVPAIFSIPLTMRKLQELLPNATVAAGYEGLINCEDEAYMAAAGGFTMGIMRHPFRGALPDGRADMSFPAVHRDLKTKIQEVTRAVRWHRIAPAFGAAQVPVYIDTATLTDTWQFLHREEELEEWWLAHPFFRDMQDGTLHVSAPARIARGCPLPEVEADEMGAIPFLLASRHPNGAYAIAALGRTLGRTYRIPRCHVTCHTGGADTVAIFGDHASLTLAGGYTSTGQYLMQDLAGNTAWDITADVTVREGQVCIPGACIRQIGTAHQAKDDTSEPGVMLRWFHA